MTIVEVCWIDACYEEGEFTKNELVVMQPLPRRHLGYVLRETETELLITPEWNEWSAITMGEDTHKATIEITKSMITKLVVLRGTEEDA